LTLLGSVLFNFLNSISHFPNDIVDLAKSFEIGLFLVDCTGSGIFLLAGMVRIVTNALEDH
jgi:hypothetical protein